MSATESKLYRFNLNNKYQDSLILNIKEKQTTVFDIVMNFESSMFGTHIRTYIKCSICRESIIFIHKLYDDCDRYYDCQDKPISKDQYNAGILNPLCDECNHILTYHESIPNWGALLPRHFFDHNWHHKKRILRVLYGNELQIPPAFYEPHFIKNRWGESEDV